MPACGLHVANPSFANLFGQVLGEHVNRLTRATWASALICTLAQSHTTRGTKVIRRATASLTASTDNKTRIGARRKVRVPGRLTWRDSSGTLRFVSVMTCDVSDLDAFVECQVPASIPLYRLVHFQIERGARECDALPSSLRNGKVLSAVYRVGAYRAATGTPHGYALRLLVEPTSSAPAVIQAVAN